MEKPEATAKLVKEEVNSSLYLKEILKKGLINYSELARQLLPKIKEKNEKANFASILISLQRYYDEIKKSPSKHEVFIREQLPKLELIMKTKVITLSYERNKKVINLLNEISKEVRWDAGDIMFFIQGTSEITIILDEKNENKFYGLKTHLLERKEGLATLSVREPESLIYSKEVPGFLALLTSTLADNNINIYEIATTFKQEIFVINEKDLTKAYDSFNDLIEHYHD